MDFTRQKNLYFNSFSYFYFLFWISFFIYLIYQCCVLFLLFLENWIDSRVSEKETFHKMEPKIQTRPLSTPKSQKAFYGIGQILNDLCVNSWYSYALLYWTKIVRLSDANAGLLLLIGQFANASSALIVGYLSDCTNIRWYGRRKLWHLIGCIGVVLGFPFILNLCFTCNETTTETSRMFYYATFVIILQFGWAATDNSHLALIPEIAKRTSDVVHLNAIR